MKTRNIFIVVAVVVILLAAWLLYFFELRITDYNSCVDAGYASLESYPAQCNTFFGRHFVQVLDQDDGQISGGQRDENGCLGPAGYSWNATERECVREWETGEGRYQVTNFATCKDAGYGIMESLPRKCDTPGGRRFVE